MAISKIIYKSSAEDTGTVWMDVTQKTVTAGTMLNGTTALKNDGTDITGNIASKTSSDLTANVLTVTAPAGHYASAASKTLTDQYLLAENIKKDISIFGVTGTYEGGGGGTSWETVYNGTQSITDDWGNGKYYVMINSWGETIDLNSVWRITWDGTPYECTATWAGSQDGDPYAIGNYTYDGGSGGTDNPFFMQVYWSSELAIVTAVSGSHTIKIEKQVSGGGSSYKLLASEEVTVSTSSTSSTTIPNFTITVSRSNHYEKILYIKIRDKAGPRNGYFYGTDTYWKQPTDGSTLNAYRLCCTYITNSGVKVSSSSQYGIYPSNPPTFSSNSVTMTLNTMYNSSYSLIVDGTYVVEVYDLEWPNNVSPFG